jgi:hypothetical protein
VPDSQGYQHQAGDRRGHRGHRDDEQDDHSYLPSVRARQAGPGLLAGLPLSLMLPSIQLIPMTRLFETRRMGIISLT